MLYLYALFKESAVLDVPLVTSKSSTTRAVSLLCFIWVCLLVHVAFFILLIFLSFMIDLDILTSWPELHICRTCHSVAPPSAWWFDLGVKSCSDTALNSYVKWEVAVTLIPFFALPLLLKKEQSAGWCVALIPLLRRKCSSHLLF